MTARYEIAVQVLELIVSIDSTKTSSWRINQFQSGKNEKAIYCLQGFTNTVSHIGKILKESLKSQDDRFSLPVGSLTH